MARLFGTDGVRGIAGEDLTPGLAMLIGRGAATVLTAQISPAAHPDRQGHPHLGRYAGGGSLRRPVQRRGGCGAARA